MKILRRPPSWNVLLDNSIECGEVGRVMEAMVSPSADDTYRHWDKLRHLTPPEGLTHDQWWLCLKLKRLSMRKPVPLNDQGGAAFHYGLVDPLLELCHQVDLSAGGMITMPELVRNPETRRTYLVRSLIEEAFASSQLEGAATTRERAQAMIRKGQVPRNRGEQMVLNNYRTMEQIRVWKDEPLSPRLVFDIHRMMTAGTLDRLDAVGRFRRVDEEVVVGSDVEDVVYHIPPNAAQLPGRMERMCAFANGGTIKPFVHPAIRSMILHFWLAFDHPFVDGNGRTARALFYWSMLHHGYWLFEYMSISSPILGGPSRYLRAFLETETDDNDLTYFLVYHADVIEKAIRGLQDDLDRKTAQVREAQAELRSLDDLNPRQRQLILEILQRPGQTFTIDLHKRITGVVTQTARTDLLGLVDRGYFLKRKAGRAWEFVPVADLHDRLRGSSGSGHDPGGGRD